MVRSCQAVASASRSQSARTCGLRQLGTGLQATEKPFINAIFDREPLKHFVYNRVVLLGEAAHPTTPHGLHRCLLLLASSVSRVSC